MHTGGQSGATCRDLAKGGDGAAGLKALNKEVPMKVAGRFISPVAVCLTAVLALCTACSGGGGAKAANKAITKDSAGIEIVTNEAPAWDTESGWRVADKPSLDIGVTAGAAEYQLADAHSAIQMADGRIAVANGQTNEIWFYDATGKFLKKTGGTGQGPGEFEQLYRLKHIQGDSLMALEPATLTSIFTPDGKYVRRFELDPVPGRGNIWWLGRLDGGVLVAFSLQREGTQTVAGGEGPNGEGSHFVIPKRPEGYRDSLMHFLYDMNGRMIDSIGKMPSQWQGERSPFPPNAAYAFSGDHFYHSPGDVVEIRVFKSLITDPSKRPAGPLLRVERIIRQGNGGLPVTDAVKNEYVESQRAFYQMLQKRNPGRGMDMQAMERSWRDMKYPARLPAHANRMYVDADGNIWLQQYQIDPRVTSQAFYVFDAGGKWLGNVTMPSDFVISEIGTNYVLGIWHDDLDVQHIRKYALNKS
jgi:hypothetical protein